MDAKTGRKTGGDCTSEHRGRAAAIRGYIRREVDLMFAQRMVRDEVVEMGTDYSVFETQREAAEIDFTAEYEWGAHLEDWPNLRREPEWAKLSADCDHFKEIPPVVLASATAEFALEAEQ